MVTHHLHFLMSFLSSLYLRGHMNVTSSSRDV